MEVECFGLGYMLAYVVQFAAVWDKIVEYFQCLAVKTEKCG